ncbi:MAG: ABC transporter permease [Treponema sp.]|nr:ABC transporter permease [Treponema sp.]
MILSFASPAFLTALNLRSVGIGFATNCIVVIGMAMVIICGGIDLSVGSVLCLSCALSGSLFYNGMPMPWASAAGIAASILCGVFCGFLISYHNMPPFIVTMAMMSIARGVAYILTTGTSISLINKLPPGFKFVGSGSIGPIPFIVLICAVVGLIADILFRKLPLLRLVYYVGSNERAAAFSGITVRKVKLYVYIISALLAGLAGQLFLSRFSYATPVAGNGLELIMIAGCVIGGVSMEGGEGTVLGSILGIVMLSLINNALILLNVSVYWQQFVSGCILITAVWLDFYRVRRANRKLNQG